MLLRSQQPKADELDFVDGRCARQLGGLLARRRQVDPVQIPHDIVARHDPALRHSVVFLHDLGDGEAQQNETVDEADERKD